MKSLKIHFLPLYGMAFHDKEVMGILSEQIGKRLELLEKTLQSAMNENEKIRLRQAIKSHRGRLDISAIS